MWIANVHFTDTLDHIWGLVHSKVPTFTVLILPLRGLSYPKNNHHALFTTFSMNARQCVASEKSGTKPQKTTELSYWRRRSRAHLCPSHVETDAAVCLNSTRASSGSVTCHGSVLICVRECTPRSLPTCHHLFCASPFASSCRRAAYGLVDDTFSDLAFESLVV